jgi:hypothetical protein
MLEKEQSSLYFTEKKYKKEYKINTVKRFYMVKNNYKIDHRNIEI